MVVSRNHILKREEREFEGWERNWSQCFFYLYILRPFSLLPLKLSWWSWRTGIKYGIRSHRNVNEMWQLYCRISDFWYGGLWVFVGLLLYTVAVLFTLTFIIYCPSFFVNSLRPPGTICLTAPAIAVWIFGGVRAKKV